MLTRRIIHVLATIAIAAGTVLVLDQTGLRASHQFSDVGNGNFFHESIGAIGSAGCASGFNDGTFRPNSRPTRRTQSPTTRAPRPSAPWGRSLRCR